MIAFISGGVPACAHCITSSSVASVSCFASITTGFFRYFIFLLLLTMMPNQSLQRTRLGHPGCRLSVTCAGSLSSGVMPQSAHSSPLRRLIADVPVRVERFRLSYGYSSLKARANFFACLISRNCEDLLPPRSSKYTISPMRVK